MSRHMDKIIAFDGMCILGPEPFASDDVSRAFSEGSAKAYAECASLARSAKADFDLFKEKLIAAWADEYFRATHASREDSRRLAEERFEYEFAADVPVVEEG